MYKHRTISHREQLESNIDAEVIHHFKNAKVTCICCGTDTKYEELYNLRIKVLEDETDLQDNSTPPPSNSIENKNHSPVTSNNNHIIFSVPMCLLDDGDCTCE